MRAVRRVRGPALDLSSVAFVREGRVHDLSEEGRPTQRERHPILHESDRRWTLVPSQAQHHSSRSHAFQSSPHQGGQCGMYYL